MICIGLLAAFWGASCMFIKVANRAFEPAAMMLVRFVACLLPVTALVYGVTLLGELLTVEELLGMVLILGGVALGWGALRLTRREPVAAPSP